ncbi:SDR family NAD(P)-dependent oxidoreductase [Cyclobacterium sp.]|uniref:SDR family NAD(P)-dependent oxidoreductase n=1 Tax=Cyclobacterium sp. TaxID=1966343 RepID=UPI0019A5F5D2|nr:SDR family NAD(P)-dependent oxidoreductase [Cyclobacterium sp.]MBD3631270.1 SDR family NAD(P)-dependent oxidoreductase [Cyclobacterium sp.]
MNVTDNSPVILITRGESLFSGKLASELAGQGASILLCAQKLDERCEWNKYNIEKVNSSCQLLIGDIQSADYCRSIKELILERFGGLDILFNNSLLPNIPENGIPTALWQKLTSFSEVGIFSFQQLTETLIPCINPGGKIINNQILEKRWSARSINDGVHARHLRLFTSFFSKRLIPGKVKTEGVLYLQAMNGQPVLAPDQKLDSLDSISSDRLFDDSHALLLNEDI